jgi:TIR domain
MSHIYISYRLGDTSEAASEICAHLCNLGFDVWMETESIPAGVDVRERIDDTIKSAGAVVAVIGQKWLEKIHDDRDLVRTELECAIQGKIPIIPAIVDGAKMPRTSELPRTLRELPYLNTAIVKGPPLVRDLEPLTHAITPFASLTSGQSSRPPPGRPPGKVAKGGGAKGDVAHPQFGSPPWRRSSAPARDTVESGVSLPSVVKPAISFVADAWGRLRASMAGDQSPPAESAKDAKGDGNAGKAREGRDG